VDQSWTDQQRRAYQRARRWTEEELVPYAPGQAFATWYARIGHDMFDKLEPAWLWWSSEKPELEEE